MLNNLFTAILAFGLIGYVSTQDAFANESSWTKGKNSHGDYYARVQSNTSDSFDFSCSNNQIKSTLISSPALIGDYAQYRVDGAGNWKYFYVKTMELSGGRHPIIDAMINGQSYIEVAIRYRKNTAGTIDKLITFPLIGSTKTLQGLLARCSDTRPFKSHYTMSKESIGKKATLIAATKLYGDTDWDDQPLFVDSQAVKVVDVVEYMNLDRNDLHDPNLMVKIQYNDGKEGYVKRDVLAFEGE